MRALGDRLARGIVGVEVRIRPVGAVEGLGKDARRRSLARAAWTDEQIRMRDPSARDGVFQRAHDVVLADDVIKRLGPPLARDNLVGGGHSSLEQICTLQSQIRNLEMWPTLFSARRGFSPRLARKQKWPGTPRHWENVVTVATFRSWRSSRACPCMAPGRRETCERSVAAQLLFD